MGIAPLPRGAFVQQMACVHGALIPSVKRQHQTCVSEHESVQAFLMASVLEQFAKRLVIVRSSLSRITTCFVLPKKTKTLQCATRKMCVLKDSWCARKAACKDEGLCAINEEPSPYKRSRVSEYLLKCRPTLGEHCEKSQACRERGACGLVPLVHSFYCGLLRAYKATSLLEREGVRGRGQVLLQRWGLCALSV